MTLANVGDTIEFQFYPTNHSVIRSEYGYPCVPYEDTGVDKVGFFSGFKPVDAILSEPPSFSLLVNDSNPIFFYCGAPGSCIEHQMVGVINPNASTSLQQQKQDAKDSSFMLLPGEPWPSEANDPFTTTASTHAPTTTSTSAPAATTSSSHLHSHSGLSGGAIAGIVIGAAAVTLGAAVALFLCGRHSRNQHNQNATPFMQQQVPFQPPPPSHVSTYDPMKHMSMHSSVVGSALPGYVPVHNPHDSMATASMPPTSPPLHPSFAPSDAFGPGSDNRSETSPQMAAVPAYTQSVAVNPHSPFGYAPSSGQPSPIVNAHEMPAAVPAQLGGGVHAPNQPQEGAGIMGFIRKSSVGKSGGVERYS